MYALKDQPQENIQTENREEKKNNNPHIHITDPYNKEHSKKSENRLGMFTLWVSSRNMLLTWLLLITSFREKINFFL